MIRTLGLLALAGLVLSCQAPGRANFDRWDASFAHRPAAFSSAVTALWISGYQEDAKSHRFVRYSAVGTSPEKLIPDRSTGDSSKESWTALLNLHRQAETSDGPVADQVVDYLVRVTRSGDVFSFVPTNPLPPSVALWVDSWNRTVHARGFTQSRVGGVSNVLWEFKGRY